MTPKVQVGFILIQDRPLVTRSLESDPYSGNWSLVKALDRFALDRKIHAAGWNFFFMAEEVKATVFGSLAAKSIQKALKRICLKVDDKASRASLSGWPEAMSKSKSIRRAAFHHSEAVTQFLERPWLSGKWPVSKMFHSDTAVLLRSCPRMILVSAMNRGEQAHELAMKFAIIFNDSRRYTFPASMRNYRLHASACRLLGCVSRVPGLKCGRCMPILALSLHAFAVCNDQKHEHDYEIVLKPPEVASFSPKHTLHGAWLREKGLCPKSGYRPFPPPPEVPGIPRGHRPVHVPKHLAWEPGDPAFTPDGIRLGRIGKSKDASREDATAGVRSVCDRPAAVAWRRETGNVQFSWLHAYLREEEEQRTVHGCCGRRSAKGANETEGGRKPNFRGGCTNHPEVGKCASGGAFRFSYSVGIPE